ncbi:MAG: 5-(carboxyamino)imidazole ribonucleotide synthase [Candidatus Schmidhempelia sp.]|nr:5-(carboxyamino)imidazole ribonucleotide synthase [Candidatus Schmidhempelia sp.]
MKSVCVIGNGQLGRMLRQAGEPLGISVHPIGSDDKPDKVPYQQAIITAEVERWADTELTRLLAHHPHFINQKVFPLIADRLTQKQLIDQLNLPTAAWQSLDNSQQWKAIFQQLGDKVIIKRRTGGYDGHGQWRLTIDDKIDLPSDIYQSAIVEEAINFDSEISLIGARDRQGKCVFYPMTHNLHQNGILKVSVAHAYIASRWQIQAEQMLTTIMTHLSYVGVMAMECFVIDDQLLINELAPRVHNSGHWTQNGASISQFELHLRTILDLPVPRLIIPTSSVMVNLIGMPLNYQWLTSPCLHLHWYDKEVRAGRKVGHVNLTHHNSIEIQTALFYLAKLLPDDYQSAIIWAVRQLT